MNELVKMAEESMQRVLDLTEAIEVNRGAIQPALEHFQEKFGGEHAADAKGFVELMGAAERRLLSIHLEIYKRTVS